MERNFLTELNKIEQDAHDAIVTIFKKEGIESIDLSNIFGSNLSVFDCDGNERVITKVTWSDFTDDGIALWDNKGIEVPHFEIGAMARAYQWVCTWLDERDKRAEQEVKKIEEYYANPQYKQIFAILPTQMARCTDDEFKHIGCACVYGKVLSADDIANIYNKGILSTLKLPDTTMITIADAPTKCVEWCPNCDNEVLLDFNFKAQICPICGNRIAPCNMCNGECSKNCPLDCR